MQDQDDLFFTTPGMGRCQPELVQSGAACMSTICLPDVTTPRRSNLQLASLADRFVDS